MLLYKHVLVLLLVEFRVQDFVLSLEPGRVGKFCFVDLKSRLGAWKVCSVDTVKFILTIAGFLKTATARSAVRILCMYKW